MKILQIIFLLFCVIKCNNLSAQETVPASGGNGSGIDGSVSYTVGQLTYAIYASEIGSVGQAIQQPFEILISTGIEETGITLECSVYPNPVKDFLLLKIKTNVSDRPFSYQLYNMNGEVLRNERIISNETSIFIQNIASSTYLLKIFDNKKQLKTFKIIKN
jgi:hypothetical protein